MYVYTIKFTGSNYEWKIVALHYTHAINEAVALYNDDRSSEGLKIDLEPDIEKIEKSMRISAIAKK